MPEDLKLSPQTYEDNEGGPAGTVSGRITDINGATVASASVSITNTATNQTFNTTTSSDGTFQSQTLAPGNYRVTISAAALSGT
jgi:protocatechuate 3,4-dioxygenase beta subunit